MDSLLANYAASDDEEEQQEQSLLQPPSNTTAPRSEYRESSSSRSSSLFSSLPPPKSSSLFQSLPQPKRSSKASLPNDLFDNNSNEQVVEEDSRSTSKSSPLFSSLPRPKGNPSPTLSSSRIDGDRDGKPAKSGSIFSSLPPPNSRRLQQPKSNLSSSEPQPKRVVLFKAPVNPSSLKSSDDDDEEDEDAERRHKKASKSSFQTPSVTSFLSSIPAPKNSAILGVLPSSGLARRSILETDAPVTASDDSNIASDSGITQNIDNCSANYVSYVNHSSGVDQNVDNHMENSDNAANYNLGTEQNAWNGVNYDGYGNYQFSVNQNVVGEAQSGSSASSAGDYGSYENYGNYGDYGQYGSNPAGPSGMMNAETYGIAENAVRIPEKRRRNEVPSEILEVKQDELIKNRPREDQVKLTGIAFGPSYQPASTKGKPSKLHKRKHQINSLFFDMKQKEMELAERRARGLLTKAETQAKYGW